MIRSSKPMMGRFLSRTALGLALSMGALAGTATLQPALAQKAPAAAKPDYSKEFVKAAGEVDKAIAEADKNAALQTARAAVRAAGTDAQKKAAAAAQVDAALGGAKAKIDAAAPFAKTNWDKYKLGEITRMYGVFVDDPRLQYAGASAMLETGLTPAQVTGQVQFLAGLAAYQNADYGNAARYLEQSKASKFQDPQNLLDALLLDSFKRSNNPAGALAFAQREIAAAKAAGTKPSDATIRAALQAALDAKNAAQANEYSVLLVQSYPSSQSWGLALNVLRSFARYEAQETLDLMRLMSRAGAMKDRNDYLEYIQSADPRRNPGEVLKVIEAGTASGNLVASNTSIAETVTLAKSRVTADQAEMPKLERDARAPAATAATAAAGADVFLNYGDAAKAADLYTIALSKPGGDAARLNTRLGIAQFDKGDYAGAQASFAKVEGPRKPLAQLWSSYAAQKAAGK